VVINPSRKDLHRSQLNLIVSATEQKKVGEFKCSVSAIENAKFVFVNLPNLFVDNWSMWCVTDTQ